MLMRSQHCIAPLCFYFRSQNADTVLKDKSLANDLKADILRRAREQIEEEEEAERDTRLGILGNAVNKEPRTVAHEDELSGDEGAAPAAVKVIVGDGELSEDDDGAVRIPFPSRSETSTALLMVKVKKTTQMLENILELAYIQDPKLFNRDANTRRSKARADLKAETGAL